MITRAPSKSCEMDPIPTDVLKKFPPELLPYITDMCNSLQQGSFYRAMLCIRGTSHGPVSVSVCVCVCLSVCLSQVGVLLKRLNVGSHKLDNPDRR